MKKYILILLMFICFMSKVEAIERRTININWIPNVYANYVKDGVPYWSQFAYLSDGGKLLYCLEINKNITRTSYNLYDFSVQNYPLEMRKDLEIINYYGYQYEGHQSLYYYMATQELIWNRMGAQVYWTTESNGKGSVINIDSYKNEIMSLYNRYFKTPNLTIPDIKVGSSNEFIDNNNILNEYGIVYNGTNDIRIDNNKLIINSYSLGNDTFSLKRELNDIGETNVYKTSDSQTLISFGNVEDNNEVKMNFMVYGGNIQIERIDSKTLTIVPSGEASLENALYSIFDTNGNIIYTGTTDSNGNIFINDLPLGEYIIREISPSVGYYPDLREYHVSLAFNDVDKVLSHVASVIGQDLMITLHYENNEPASNITFDIYNENGLVKSVTTDDNGSAKVYLLYGTYTVKQSNVKEGYIKANDFEFTTTEEKAVTYDLYNEKIVVEKPAETNNEIIGLPDQESTPAIPVSNNKETIQTLPMLYEKDYNNRISYGVILLSILIKLLFKKYA